MNLDGYIRVSQVRGREGDSFISPEQQADRIRAWAQAYGHTIGREFVELDQSGARRDRPLLEEAIRRIETGASDGLIVPRVDRFGRSLIDGLAKIERIDQAGGAFVSVQDGFDLTTDTGRLVLKIMLSLAEFELDRIRSNWEDAKSRAIARGIHPSAAVPFGYRREGRGGPLLIDPQTGPLVTELFKRRAIERTGFTELASYLQEQGAVTSRGRQAWSMRAVKDIIRNRVYLGVAYAGTLENRNAHAPLTDPDTWELAQQPGQKNAPLNDSPGPVSRGLLRCAACRYKMIGRRLSNRREPGWTFSCRTMGDGGWNCSEPAHTLDRGELDALVVEEFMAAIPRMRAKARMAAPKLAVMDQEVLEARTAFVQWRDDARLQASLGMDAYVAGLESRKATLDDAVTNRASEVQRSRSVAIDGTPDELRAAWEVLEARERRELLEAAIDSVFVRGSSRSTAPLRDRVRVVFRGELPLLELPAVGVRGFEPSPVSFDDLDRDLADVRVTPLEDASPRGDQ